MMFFKKRSVEPENKSTILQQYDAVPKTQVGIRLEILSKVVKNRRHFVLREMNEVANALGYSYRRKFKDNLISEVDKLILEYNHLPPKSEWNQINFNKLISDVFKEVDEEFAESKKVVKQTMQFYINEPKFNFGNRLNQLADILAASYQIGLDADRVTKLNSFVSSELKELSKIIGNDY